MLLKNVYIMYPAGCGGTFINWAINASDIDTSKNTVKNPISANASEKTGGPGTAHLHVKLPTHHGTLPQIVWMLYNKPTQKQAYACNVWNSAAGEIAVVRQFDPTGIFIVIHHNNDPMQNSLGTINNVIKWPTYLSAILKKDSEQGCAVVHPTFDPHNCAHDREFRNWAIRVAGLQYLLGLPPIDWSELKSIVDMDSRWYYARNAEQPHEVNEMYYNTDFSYADRIFEIDLKTLFSDKFVPWFENFMKNSGVSSEYNTDQVKIVAPEYLKSQATLQWYDSMEQWKKTGKFDSFISSHSIIEAEAIRYMLRLKPELDAISDWDVKTAQEISDRHFTSDDFK